MPVARINPLRTAIFELEEFCDAVLRRPDDRAASAELVRWLTSDQSPLRNTEIDRRLDTAIGRVQQAFQSWQPLIRDGRARPSDWAAELKSGLFVVKAEIERIEQAAPARPPKPRP